MVVSSFFKYRIHHRDNLKPIRFSNHARDQLGSRGGTEQEVIEAIRSCSWEPANKGRITCRKDFPYRNQWNRKYYEIKQVSPIFVDEPSAIVVVTVFTYFF